MADPQRVQQARELLRQQMGQTAPAPVTPRNAALKPQNNAQGDSSSRVEAARQILRAQYGNTPVEPQVQQKPSFLQRAGLTGSQLSKFTEPARQTALGFAKSFANVGNTLLKPINKRFEQVTGKKPTFGQLGESDLKANNFFEKAGKFAGDAAFASRVAGAVSPVASAVTKSSNMLKAPNVVKKVADISGRSALLAGEGYGTAKLMGAENDDAKTAAVISGALPWASAGFSLVGRAVGGKALGQKMQNALIKPSKKDLDNGFKIENITKYHLGGNLEETAKKTQKAIASRAAQLRGQLKEGSAVVDLNEVLDDTKRLVDDVKFENAGSNMAIQRELEKFEQELRALSKNGKVDIARAQEIKRAFGFKGAWEHNVPREDANAIETVYNFAYNRLREKIEQSAAAAGNTQVKQINKELSELIPIEQALARRLPVAARQNPISLTDLVSVLGGAKLGVPLLVLNKLSKSGGVASKLAGLGTRPASRGAIGTMVSGPGEEQLKKATTLKQVGDQIPEVNVGLSIKPVGGTTPRPNLPEGWTAKSIPNTNKIRNIASIPNPNPKAIDEATKQEMIDVIDYVRLKQPFNLKREDQIGDLVEKYGITDKTLAGIANKLERLVERTKTVSGVSGRNLKR